MENETIAVLGYGVQGPGQALNLRDNGIRVIVGQREGGKTWDRAVADGFVPGETLFPLERKRPKRRPSFRICFPMPARWPPGPRLKACLNAGDALYFSHGFGIVFKDQTHIIPPDNVDVIMVAPKGSGRNVSAIIFWTAAASIPAMPYFRILPATPDRKNPGPRYCRRVRLSLSHNL